MIFPIGDDQVQGGHKPLVAYLLIGINLVVFFFQLNVPAGQQQAFVDEYGLIPREIVQGTDMHALITSMFLHGGWMHLIGNMLFLWVFGDNIEAVIGKFWFIVFYLCGGLAASAAHIFFHPDSALPTVGASGAISAVLGAYLVMFPASRVKVWVIYFFGSVSVPAIFFLGLWAVQQFVNGFIAILPSNAYASGVAWWAHIGGFVFGVVTGFFIRKHYDTLHLRRDYRDLV